jgi:hypothetical protein
MNTHLQPKANWRTLPEETKYMIMRFVLEDDIWSTLIYEEVDLTQLTSVSDALIQLTPASHALTDVPDVYSRNETSALYIKDMRVYAREAFLRTRICRIDTAAVPIRFPPPRISTYIRHIWLELDTPTNYTFQHT